MTLPSLPAQGSTSWYDWANAVHLLAAEIQSGRLTEDALRGAFGRAAPVLSDFSYEAGTGNLLSYKEDGISVVLTYNSDGTVATSKRGDEPVQTFSYSGGNLVGVA